MILPNFLIVGAAKCGTSSIASYIDQHPDIYMSKVKEPRFITSQFTKFPLNGPKANKLESWYVKDYDQYLNLFKDVKNEKAIGEASVDNLFFHRQSIPLIKQYLGNPKIIIILRHPVKRAFSAYSHMIRDERESFSFEKAITLEEERRENNWEFLYSYTEASKYYSQVKSYFDNFDNVLVLLNEELKEQPDLFFKEIFSFLEVDPDFKVDHTIRYNESGAPRSRAIHNFFSDNSKVRKAIQPLVRIFLSAQTRKILSNKIQSKNLKNLTLSQDTKENLKRHFREDILKLQTLINKDLSSWI